MEVGVTVVAYAPTGGGGGDGKEGGTGEDKVAATVGVATSIIRSASAARSVKEMLLAAARII